jgi:hypothetical protein
MSTLQSPPAEPIAPRRRDLAVAGLVASLASASIAASPAAAAEEKSDGPEVNPLQVDIAGIVVPVANAGNLVNYLFTSIRVVCANDSSAVQVRNTQFLAKDLIVRAAGRRPVPVGQQANAYNAAEACAMMKAAIEGGFRGVSITSVALRDPQLMRY